MGVIICIIVQGPLFYEHVHVIDENIEQKRAQDGALGQGIHLLFVLAILTLNSGQMLWV